MDGLATIDVGRVIVEDRWGDLWFTSFGSGVTRYDGESLTVYNMRDSLIGLDVRQILEGRQGNLWSRSGGPHISRGVSRFDYARFTSLTPAVSR